MIAAHSRQRRPRFRLLAVALFASMWYGATMPATAANVSRAVGTTLFIAGMGLKVGGTIVGNQARETYDDYLLTALQADIASRRADYRSKRRLADGLSATADGLLVVGALMTVYSLLRSAPLADNAISRSPAIRLVPNIPRREVVASWRRAF